MSTTIRVPNRTGQLGVYKTGTPNYVDVDNTNTPLIGKVTFAIKAVDDSWITGDLVGILIKKDDNNYKVWTAEWDGINEYLKVVIEEESVGTLLDADVVNVIAVLTTKIYDKLIYEVQSTEVTETTYTVLATDKGKQICCTSAFPVIITFPSTLPTDFYCSIIQEGTGKVALISSGTDTINGLHSRVYVSDSHKAVYVYQRVEGIWIALIGPPYGISKDPYWDNVVLFMNMEGANAGTSFYDLSNTPHTISILGSGVTTNNTQKKWGISSAYTNKTGHLQSTALAGDALNGDFTIECWIYPSSRASGGAYAPGWIGWGVHTAGITLHMSVVAGSVGYFEIYINNTQYIASDSIIPLSTWSHIAVARSGGSIMGFLNGVKKNIVTSTVTIAGAGSIINLLGWFSSPTNSTCDGYVDAVRVTNGVARYTANFDPATLTEFSYYK